MRSNIFASGLAVVLGMGSPIVGTMVMPEVAIAQPIAESPVESLLATGKQQYRRAEFKLAIVTYQQALTLAQQKGDRATQIDALLQLADMNFWMGQLTEVDPKLQQALKLARESGDRKREGQTLSLLAALYREQGKYPKAMELLNQTLTIGKEIKDSGLEARSQFFIGTVLYRQVQYPQALEALELAQDISDQDEAALIQNWVTLNYVQLKDFKQAEVSQQRQQELSRSIGYRLAEYGGLYSIVNLAQEQKQTDRVLQAYQQQLTIAQSANNPWFQQNALIEIGFIYMGQKQLDKGLEFYQQALTIARTIDEPAVAQVLSNLADKYYYSKDYPKSLELYQQALEIYKKWGNRPRAIRMFVEIGSVYRALKQPENRMNSYKQALDFYQKNQVGNQSSDDFAVIGEIYNLIGNVDYGRDKYNQAILSYQTSLGNYQRVSDRPAIIAQVWSNLGNAYYYSKDYQSALDSYQKALNIRQKNSDRTFVIKSFHNIGEAYRKFDKPRDAIKTYQAAIDFYQKTQGRDITSTDRIVIGELNNRIGVIYYSNLENYSQALIEFEKALKDYQLGKQLPDEIALVQINLADAYQNLNQYSEALDNYQKGLKEYQKINKQDEIVEVLKKIAINYRLQKQPETAIKIYEQIILLYQNEQSLMNLSNTSDRIGEIYNRIGVIYSVDMLKKSIAVSTYQKALDFYIKSNKELDSIAKIWLNIGVNHYDLQEYSQAIDAQKKALLIYQQTSNIPGEAVAWSNLSQTYRQLGDANNALEANEKARQKNQTGIQVGADRNISVTQGLNLSGVWKINASETSEKDNTEIVTISQLGQRYKLLWETRLGIRSGIALAEEGQLFAAWDKETGNREGLVVYQIREDGSLDGKWLEGIDGTGTEKATGNPTGLIEGDYRVAGKNYDGGRYEGKLKIEKTGETYQFLWDTGTEYRGVGIRDGNRLIVGWGNSGFSGVSVYDFKGNRLIGKSASLNQAKLTTETLVLNPNNTQKYQQKVLAIRLQAEGENLWSEGKREAAIKKMKEALEISIKNNDLNLTAILLQSIGSSYGNEEDFTQSLKYYELALNKYQELNNTLEVAISLNMIGVIYSRQGEYANSRNAYQKALLIASSLRKAGLEAMVLGNIATTYTQQGDYKKALPLAEKALVIHRDQTNRSAEGGTLSKMGLNYAEQGLYTQALNYYQQAIDTYNKAGEIPNIGLVKIGIGNVYANQGNYQKALEFYNESLNKIRSSLVKNRGAEATSFTQIGRVYSQLGIPEKALEFHQKALSTYQELGYQASIGATLTVIGDVFIDQNQYSKALEAYQRGLSIARSVGDVNQESKALYGLGRLYIQQGQPQQALENLQKALVIQQKIGIRPQESATLSKIGQVQIQFNQFDDAQSSLQRSIVLAQEIGDVPTQATTLANLADLATKQKQNALAIVLYKQSVLQYEAIRKGLAPLPKDQQESYTKTVSQTYRNLADLLIQNDRLLEAQQILGLLKLQEIKDYSPTTRNALQENEVKLSEVEQEIAKKYGTLIAFRQKLDQCQGKINNADCEKLDRDRDEQGKALNNFLANLKLQVIDRCQKDQADTCLTPSNQFTSAANKLIAAQPGSLVIMPVVLDNKIWILTISENGTITRYESKVDRITLGKKVLELRQQLETPNSDIKELQATSKQLYDWLIKPIEPTLKTAKTPPKLIFALDRVTRYIPMGVLYDGQQYLTQRYPISTILSIETTNTNKSTIGNLTTTNVLALGLTKAVSEFRALPSVNPELASIVQKSGIYPGQILLDRDFTRSNLSNNLKNRNILHIATHGKFDPTQPKGSFLVLGNGEKLPIADISTLDYSQLDLVVLSACQTALGNPDQDGTEIPGISSHFLNNGAASVMASLWSVDDSSTALMMQSFYRNLSTKPKNEALRQAQLDLLKLNTSETSRTAIEALPRFAEPLPDAKTATRQPPQSAPGYSHPYYWAPFILIGNSQ